MKQRLKFGASNVENEDVEIGFSARFEAKGN
jgi:hypothetical protein